MCLPAFIEYANVDASDTHQMNKSGPSKPDTDERGHQLTQPDAI